MTETGLFCPHRKFAENLATANAANKGAVFDALAAAGISEVEVEFDGAGDSGQINDIVAQDTFGANRELPGTSVRVERATWDSNNTSEEVSLRDAVEMICYGYLEHEHGGWEINEGSRGTFRFEVVSRILHLDFEAWFMDSTTHSHNF